jgi:multiple sugar transport system substrate-binding protein
VRNILLRAAVPFGLVVVAVGVYLFSEFYARHSGRTRQETVISFWAFAFPAQTMKILKTEFEDAHPGIRVEVQTVAWEHLQQKALWAIAANSNVPDVIVASSEWVGGLVSAGALEPLDGPEFPAEFFQRYFPAALGVYQFPEVRRDQPGEYGRIRQYGIPLDLDLMMIFYRADLVDPILERLGFKAFPEDWENFQKLGRAVFQEYGTSTPAAHLLYLDPEDPVPMTMAFLPASGARVLSEDYQRAVFNSPEAVEAFRLFAQLLKDECAIRWERGTMEDPMVLYKTHRVLANISGPWFSKHLERRAPELSGKWKVALFPRRKPEYPSCGLGGACLAIPYNAPHKREAAELLRFMATERFALAYFQRVGSPPPQVTAWSDPTFDQPVAYFGGQKIYHVVRRAIETAQPIQIVPKTQVTRDVLRKSLRAICDGRDLHETLDAAVQEANAILAE